MDADRGGNEFGTDAGYSAREQACETDSEKADTHNLKRGEGESIYGIHREPSWRTAPGPAQLRQEKY